jgi:UDP-glucose 4-epimerase
LWQEDVEIFQADLRSHPDLLPALENIDAVVHLAASMSGDDVHRFSDTVTGTERLFEATARSEVKRMVLCSSFSVYDWLEAHGTVDEQLPVAKNIYACGGYASAKLWQERMAERMSREHGWELTVLRPGFIWGPGNECPGGSIGRSAAGLHLVFGPRRLPPFTHVNNCADCFRAAVEDARAIGKTFNVVDDHCVTAWRFMGEHLRRSGSSGIRVPLPYWLLWLMVALVNLGSRVVLGPRAHLPSLFTPEEFAQCCRPLRYDTARLGEVLGWRTPLDFDRCLERTYGSCADPGAAEARAA